MAAEWRSTVPSKHMFGSLGGQPQDNVDRFKPTVGKDITHRLATGSLELISFVVPMTYNEFIEFREMYRVDLADGSLNFRVRDPLTGLHKYFSFAEVYSWQQVTMNSYHVGMSLTEEPAE